MHKLREYYADNDSLLYCPMTSRTYTEGAPPRYAVIADQQGNRYGSYALNEWVYDDDDRDAENYWRHAEHSGLNNIPVMADASWRADAQPYATDQPPEYDGEPRSGVGSGGNEMRIFCINRHDGAVNCLFMDWAVRRVSLKELWSLKWHRNYDTSMTPVTWPDWMRNFDD
jgi:prepilin-type processing-associated H-X9-DG protein